MFLFIVVGETLGNNGETFKYISCFYLSLKIGKKEKIMKNLNTSHVFIYQLNDTVYIYIQEFKYISCFYLSLKIGKKEKIMKNLNTSHVFIYLVLTLEHIYKNLYLNTSHVFIYPLILSPSVFSLVI